LNTPNFSDIYTLYFEDVYKYLLALCHDEELAEELAQDTFFKAMKSYNSDENQLFFNGKSVCYFADNRATDGTFEGTEVHSANGDIGIITERDRNGNITGLKQMEIPELTDFLEKSWKEK